MNANDVIEAYVNDVAVQLPRRQRNDVAFELRALLAEGLQDRADEAGRAADAAMALECVRAFGRPEEVAARYLPAVTVIDAADGRAFWRWTIIGLVVLWVLGLPRAFGQPDGLQAIAAWWLGAVLPSLWWPGLMVMGFGGAAWVRRRWPQTGEWTPRPGDRLNGGRASVMLGIVGIACGLVALFDPRWILDAVWAGHAAPAAYEALTYTDSFRAFLGPVLFGLVALNIPLLIAAIVAGRWTPRLRRLEVAGGVATCAAMAWAIVAGPIFRSPQSDGMTKLILGFIVAFTLLYYAIQAHRSVRPGPKLAGNGA